jgi:hypothetical protein
LEGALAVMNGEVLDSWTPQLLQVLRWGDLRAGVVLDSDFAVEREATSRQVQLDHLHGFLVQYGRVAPEC